MTKTISVHHKQKTDTHSNWTTNNPVLLAGEIGYESDTRVMKVGDGTNHWNDLSGIAASTAGMANTSLSNLTDTGKNITNWSSNVSNCIVEIPQDIKLEITTQIVEWAWHTNKDDFLYYTSTATPSAGDELNPHVSTSSIRRVASVSADGLSLTDTDGDTYTRSPSNDITTQALVLKAGSKLYVPNGSGVFNTVTIASDITISGLNVNTQYMLFTNTTGTFLFAEYLSSCSSGTSMPAGTWKTWYDTTNNKVKRIGNTAGTVLYEGSFPIAMFTVSSGAISSIDQIFNGIGYIGSTIFALPGIKGLIPNGRNADGSLKNTFVAFSAVNVMTMADWMPNRRNCTLNIFSNASIGGMDVTQDNWGSVLKLSDLPRGSYYGCWYCEEDNLMHFFDNSANESITTRMFAGSFDTDSNNKITRFNTKTEFHAVDYSDTEFIANQAMPSDNYINLTLGASGTSYIAPADGYIHFAKNATAANQRVKLFASITQMAVASWSTGAYNTEVLLPVSKGETVNITYTADGTTNYFRFTYANGAV